MTRSMALGGSAKRGIPIAIRGEFVDPPASRLGFDKLTPNGCGGCECGCGMGSERGGAGPGAARRARGFTLFEMLVALAIFALASALAYGGLDALLRARNQLDGTQERLGRLQFALGLIERDLRSVAPRPVRDGYGLPHGALEGTGDRFEVTRGGLANALALPRAELERVGWRSIDGQLQRRRYAVLDRAPGSTPSDDDVLEQVDSLRLRYLDAQGREQPQWPPSQGSAEALPRAVIVTLTLADFGELRRVLELPQEAPREPSP
jgi:general secretion pathway protein J